MFRQAEKYSRMDGASDGRRGQSGARPRQRGNDLHSDSIQRQSLVDRIFQQDTINFVLTNRIPRRTLTTFMGWFSEIEQPLVRDLSIGVWRLFAGDLNLGEARQTTFRSLHDCFIRQLKDG